MAKKSSRNSDILYNAKEKTSPKIYSILLNLVNDHREDLAEVVLKIDYLLQYASTCINQKDFEEAREGLKGARMRIDMLIEEKVDTEHLEYLYEGIYKKCKK